MKLEALNDWVFVSPVKEETGIAALDEKGREKPSKAVVVSVGNGEKARALNIKEGETILLRKWAVEEFEVDGQKYYCLLAPEVFAKFSDESSADELPF